MTRYGTVDFLMKFGEFLQVNKMSDLTGECQVVIRNLLRRKTEEITYEPVKGKMIEIVEGTILLERTQ